MNISQQIDQMNASLLNNFSSLAKSDIELAALVLDLTYLLKQLKTDGLNEQSMLLVTDEIGRTLSYIILKESK